MEKVVISDLRECPFCDSTNLVQIANVGFDDDFKQVDSWHIECKDCMARGGREDTLEDAKARWNGDYEYFEKKELPNLFSIKFIAFHTQAKDGGTDSQVEFEANDMQEARTWVQNHLDMSYEWTIREL